MLQLFPAREIFLQFSDFTIHWYGLLWVLSFWLVWYLAPRLQKYRSLTLSRDEWTKIIAWGAVGALIGGRLGYVLFYEPTYFLQNPAAIFMLWQGGMASHGGFIGAALAVWFVIQSLHTKKTTHIWVYFLKVMDVFTVPIALSLALGRLGNFINGEIFGNNPIAIGKNLLIALACWLLLRVSRVTRPITPKGYTGQAWVKPLRPAKAWRSGVGRGKSGEAGPARWMKWQNGFVASAFLILYSILRFLIEPLRDDPWPLMWGLTRGQILTLPVLAAGVWLLICRVVKNR